MTGTGPDGPSSSARTQSVGSGLARCGQAVAGRPRRIDALLEEEDVLDPIVTALAARWAHSRRRGRPGTPAEIVLRMLVLKHLYRWSCDEVDCEVRTNLVFHAFARIGGDAVPDAKTILKIARVLGPDAIQQVHARVVQLAVAAGVTKGRRLRIDTTVVETHVHYPTDSTLLRDSVRVVTRTLQGVGDVLSGAAARVRNRLRRWAVTVSRSPTRRGARVMPQSGSGAIAS